MAWTRCDDVGHCRVYQRPAKGGGHLTVMFGREPFGRHPFGPDGRIGWHLSISHRTDTYPPKPGRYPTWDEIVRARDRFIPDGVRMVQVLPPRAERVNAHETTFHLWETWE